MAKLFFLEAFIFLGGYRLGIEQIEVYAVTLTYREPFVIAPSTTSESHNIIAKIVTDYDVVGWGESSPSKRVTGETVETVVAAFDKFGPKLVGHCPLRIEHDFEVMDEAVAGNSAAKAAIDIALHDVLGKTAGKPLFRLIGGYRTEVLTDITLSLKTSKEMALDALRAVDKGFKALKVKVGVNPAEDVERVKMVREAVGNSVLLRVDANQGWTKTQALEALDKMEKFDIQFVEQPVLAEDIKDLAFVRRNSPIPIMADESVHSPADALRLIRAEAADMFNIKLMKCGGILQARKIASVAEAAGLPCMVGCMSESGIGIAGAAHFAAAVRNVKFADLDSDLLLKENLVEEGGVGIKDSVRVFSKYHGLGIKELDSNLLGKPVRVYK